MPKKVVSKKAAYTESDSSDDDMPLSKKKPMKSVRGPTKFQLFISKTMKDLRNKEPGLSNKEIMRLAAKEWNRQKASSIEKAESENSSKKEESEKSSNKKDNNETSRHCVSIKSVSEPNKRCKLIARAGEKYCALHLSQDTIIDYDMSDIEIVEPDEIKENALIKKIELNSFYKNHIPAPDKEIKKDVLREEKVNTINNLYHENESNLEIKLLILANDDVYKQKIADLIGPVFNDITVSEDDQDPVTLDPIWKIQNGERVPAAINQYYLFSYLDSKNKIRCLTIFTIYDMIQTDDYLHPITMEEIPKKDINRAKELIELYNTKIGLFKMDDSNMSAEFRLKNRLTRLFKKFHMHSIYLDENWLLKCEDFDKLQKLINESNAIIKNNTQSIKPISKKNIIMFKSIKVNETIDLHEYIVDQWEKLIELTDNPQNQIPIWIIVYGLSMISSEVKEKYPDLDLMIQN